MSHMGAYSRNIARGPPGRLYGHRTVWPSNRRFVAIGHGLVLDHVQLGQPGQPFRLCLLSPCRELPCGRIGRVAVNAQDTLFREWTQKASYAPIKYGVLVTRAVPGPNKRSVCLFKGVGLPVQQLPAYIYWRPAYYFTPPI